MARLATPSFSTTMFCMAAPRAISMAVAYSFSTRTSSETGPMTPWREPLAACFITVLTLFWKPSRFLSISLRSWARWSRSPMDRSSPRCCCSSWASVSSRPFCL